VYTLNTCVYFSDDFTAVLDAVLRDGDVLVDLKVLWRVVDSHSWQQKLFQGKVARNRQDLASLAEVLKLIEKGYFMTHWFGVCIANTGETNSLK
jgi:hypothetical protein